MKRDYFLSLLKDFFSSSPCTAPFDEVHIIANPAAGGFRQQKMISGAVKELTEWKERNADEKKPVQENIQIQLTAAPGDCGRIVEDSLYACGEGCRLLFITTGGDGTGTEAAHAIKEYELENPGLQGRNVLFRLPFGTGNDGLDARSMSHAFQIFSGSCTTKKIPLLKIEFADGRIIYATNIASFGLDAWVTDQTNKLKKMIPGSFYTFMVDIAALFYERRVDLLPFRMEYIDDSGKPKEYRQLALFTAIGVSGGRSYGGGKQVLPGKENVCAVYPMKLGRKFAFKDLLYKGVHGGEPETELFSAQEITLFYDGTIPFQYDGEVLWLHKHDFPVKLSILEPCITVLIPES
jgi:diacylglycerol kinase family enzyme